MTIATGIGLERPARKPAMTRSAQYRTIKIDGRSIFYRGPGERSPAMILLHGLPSSSRTFERLFNRLADR